MKNGTPRGHVLSISNPSNNFNVTAEVVVIILAKLTMNAVNDFRIPGFRNKVKGHFMRSYIKRSVTQCYCTDLLTPYHGAELQMYWLFLVCKHVTRRPCWWLIHFFFQTLHELSSQQREMLLFLFTNMDTVTSRPNQQ